MASLRFLASLFALDRHRRARRRRDAGAQRHRAVHGAQRHRLLDGAGASVAAGDARATSRQLTFPWVWNPVILSVLSAPMSMLFGCLAVVCGYFGRRRAQLKVHVN